VKPRTNTDSVRAGPLAWDGAGDWRGRAVTTQRVPLMDLAVKQQASGEFDSARG
jgi:hypothetical protein